MDSYVPQSPQLAHAIAHHVRYTHCPCKGVPAVLIDSCARTAPPTQVNQAWVWENYAIRLAGSNYPGKCIDLKGGDVSNGNVLWLWECTGQSNQQWALDGQQIKLANTNFCIDSFAVPKDGNRLQLWECNG